MTPKPTEPTGTPPTSSLASDCRDGRQGGNPPKPDEAPIALSACPLPAKWRKLEILYRPGAEVAIDAMKFQAAVCADELDQWLATRAQQQLAADEIVEECAKVIQDVTKVSTSYPGTFYSYCHLNESIAAIRALKGKFLLSAQPNGGLTAQLSMSQLEAAMVKAHLSFTTTMPNLGGLHNLLEYLNLALSEPRTAEGRKGND
jgi:hypothetical protein